MKMAELLRQLADRLDSIDQGNDNVLSQNNAEPSDDNKFISPLQQKLELLKKGVGVESEFDSDDELTAIKKNAGISPAIVHIASDDEPLE
jgi:uncharacterized phage infection (PIP) family protein YhgE